MEDQVDPPIIRQKNIFTVYKIDNEIISFDSGSGRNPKAPDSNFGECVDIWAPGRSTLVESLSCDLTFLYLIILYTTSTNRHLL